MKEVIWVGSSYEDLKEFPLPVLHAIGYALHHAQIGKKHDRIKVLSGMGSAGIQEVRENDRSGTYRVIYTVEMDDFIFVLHAFQKNRNQVLLRQSKRLSY